MRGSLLCRINGRRAARVAAVIGFAGGASVLLGPTALAAGPVSAKPAVLQQAWYWQNAYEQANPPVAETPPATEPNGVPEGDLAVAYTGNADKSPSKMTALSFAIGDVAPGSSVQQFSFSLTLDPQPTATSFNTVEAAVVACLPTRLWPAELHGDYTDEPTVDCSKKVAPTVTGSTYTFKIPALAQTWVDDQNLGVAIVPDPDTAAAPFQLVFQGAKSAHGSLVYAPAAPVADTGGSTPTTGTEGTPATASGDQPAATGPVTVPAVPLPPVATGTGAVAPPPVVAGTPATVTPPTRPVAVVRHTSAAPTAAFWLAMVVLAVVLVAASLVLGDPTPTAAVVTRSRLDRVLRDRAGETLLPSSL
jgi:hypothetical protein